MVLLEKKKKKIGFVNGKMQEGYVLARRWWFWPVPVALSLIVGGTAAVYDPNLIRITSTNSFFKIINTEEGAFSNDLPLTGLDNDMDAASINPGEQERIFSYCFSSTYIRKNKQGKKSITFEVRQDDGSKENMLLELVSYVLDELLEKLSWSLD